MSQPIEEIITVDGYTERWLFRDDKAHAWHPNAEEFIRYITTRYLPDDAILCAMNGHLVFRYKENKE